MLLSRTAFRAAIFHLSINPALIRASTAAAFALNTPAHIPQTPSSRLYTVLFPQCAPLYSHTRTMSTGPDSTSEPTAQKQEASKSQPQDAQQSSQERLALPPIESSDGQQKLDLGAEGGSTVTLDHLGPMVVNVDGTLSRIANWEHMAEIERKNTLRIIGKRNKQRLEALKAARGEE